MSDKVTRLPEPGVILDLDSLERPESEVKPPFIVTIAGEKVTFKDPNEIDWQDLAGIEIPADLFSVAMNREDRKLFRETPLEAWKFNKLMEAYYLHYDFEEKIRLAKRQASFG